jgi:cytochrome b6-f complex iron-sulfur subunit
LNNPAGKFWLSNSEQGIVALYKVCTHLGCLYAWVEVNGRFECPCHGSKFELDGQFIEGPAPRSLDRFAMTIRLNSGGELVINEAGDPLQVDASQVSEVVIDTGERIKRDGRV